MENGHCENLIIGKNLFSTLLGIEKASKGQSVLMLNDEKVGNGQFWRHGLSELEYAFLTQWGEKSYSLNLMNLEQHRQSSPYQLRLNNFKIELGNSCFQNLVELLRKVPELFRFFNTDIEGIDKEEIEKDFDNYINQIAVECFHFRHYQNFGPSVFSLKRPWIVDLLYQFFWKKLNEGRVSQNFNFFHQFIFLANSYFHPFVYRAPNEIETLFVVLELLAPRFEFDWSSIETSLMQDFLSLEGEYVEANIGEWQLIKSRPQAALLDSFEGVIHPGHTFIMGNLQMESLIGHRTDGQCYRECEVVVRPDELFMKANRGKRGVCTLDFSVGGELPFCIFKDKGDGTLELKIPFKEIEGPHFPTLEKIVVESLLNDRFGLNLNLRPDHIEEVRFTQGQWIFGPHRVVRGLGSKGQLRSKSKQELSLKISGEPLLGPIEYWGIERNNGPGLFGFLMEFKSLVFH